MELLRALEERGDLHRDPDGCWVAAPELDWDTLPARVEGVIEERIDRLEADLRNMLTVASVQGEQFSAEVVARVEARVERDVVRQLSRELQRRHRLISEQGTLRFDGLRLSLYRFVHNLFQQYLYGNLGEAERVYLHHDIGVTLEALFADQTEPVAAQLAHHFEQADVPDKAARYRLQAGDRALRISAHREAEEHFRRGLALASRLDQGPERMQLELALRGSLGASLVVTQGYAAPGAEQEAETYLRRAIEEARARGSKALELRAARSLTQLLQRDGRAAKDRDTLAGLVDAFTEGDALPDLRQARSLLAEPAVG